jgi:hypothetical protein
MKKNMFILASSMTIFLMSCGGPKKVVKSLTPVEQPQAQVAVAPKDVNLSVESNREIVMPIVENAKPNPVKLVSFVNVDDLADLTAGMTKQEVYTKLGKKPFDVIATQADGYSICFSFQYVPVDDGSLAGVEVIKKRKNVQDSNSSKDSEEKKLE